MNTILERRDHLYLKQTNANCNDFVKRWSFAEQGNKYRFKSIKSISDCCLVNEVRLRLGMVLIMMKRINSVICLKHFYQLQGNVRNHLIGEKEQEHEMTSIGEKWVGSFDRGGKEIPLTPTQDIINQMHIEGGR